MKVSVIIRCYNEEKHIGRLLAGIMEQTAGDVEIILVDSGSTDGTLKIASHFPVKIMHIRPEEFSFGRSLNLGCQAASGDILLFASAHVYPLYRDWIELMVKPFEDQKVALVYGKQRGNDSNKYSEHQIFAKWFPESSTMNQPHPFCNNANCAIRKSLWLEQPYDENLTGLEDIDWAKKIQEKGWQIAYQSEATIIHVHDEKWKSIFNRYRREAIALRLIMKNETFNLHTFLALLWKNCLHDWKQAFREGVFIKESGSIFLFRLHQFWGTYRGYKESYLMDNQVRERFYYPNGKMHKRVKAGEEKNMIDYSKIPELQKK